MIVTVELHERDAAENQLRVYEVLDAALGRRNEIFQLVSSSADPDEAQERIRDLFDVQVPGISRAVLDIQVFRLTRSARTSPRGLKNFDSCCVTEEPLTSGQAQNVVQTLV